MAKTVLHIMMAAVLLMLLRKLGYLCLIMAENSYAESNNFNLSRHLLQLQPVYQLQV
jgi:hypothetical protein